MRNKNILAIKISVHVSLGMREADTRDDMSCFVGFTSMACEIDFL